MRRLALALLAGLLLAGDAAAAPPPIRLDQTRTTLVVTAPAYRLTLSRRNGAILSLDARPSGTRLVRGSVGCLWGAVVDGTSSYVGGCSFAPTARNRFSYRWNARAATLTLRYARAARPVGAVATLRFRPSSLDLSLTLDNRGDRVLRNVAFPADLLGDAAAVEAGYVPVYLPGIRLSREFFSRPGNSVRTYPSRYAFADWLALDSGGRHLALYSVNPAPRPLYPVALGFTRGEAPSRCSGAAFCIAHGFETWIGARQTWTSPTVRLRIGGDARESILAYRRDNGIDRYPSLLEKLGPQLATLARAPLIKADQPKGLPRFRDWGPELRRLPSPALLHPVAFQPGGHDEGYPNFLPPDPTWGTTADLRAAVEDARSLGLAVMPYLNVSWWDDDLVASPEEIAVRTERGELATVGYNSRNGYITSGYAPLVRDALARLVERWRTEVPADCLFFDQIGARPWLRDFHPASPSPVAYYDGWLEAMAPYGDRCLMAEDGWDRLAQSFAAFHGSVLMLDREHDEPDKLWGEGNWEPYPLARWLLGDKLLFYQHDLFPLTMTEDLGVLRWNLAFGFVLSYPWDGLSRTLDSPWLGLVGSLQRALGPHYAGVPLTSYRRLEPEVTESRFGDLTVVVDWGEPGGYTARTDDGSVFAGAFSGTMNGVSLSPGVHHVLVERDGQAVTVRQLVGADTRLAIEVSGPVRAQAIGRDGRARGEIDGELRGGRFVFDYRGGEIAAYRLSSSTAASAFTRAAP